MPFGYAPFLIKHIYIHYNFLFCLPSTITILGFNTFIGRMEVGYRMDYPLVNLTPFVAMQATSLQMNRFTESDRFETHASKPFAVTDTKSICH